MKTKKRIQRLESRRSDYEKTITNLVKFQHMDEQNARKAFKCPR